MTLFVVGDRLDAYCATNESHGGQAREGYFP